jgi:hypothetical protein
MRFPRLAVWMILAFVLVHSFLYAAPRLSPSPSTQAIHHYQLRLGHRRQAGKRGRGRGEVAIALLEKAE